MVTCLSNDIICINPSCEYLWSMHRQMQYHSELTPIQMEIWYFISVQKSWTFLLMVLWHFKKDTIKSAPQSIDQDKIQNAGDLNVKNQKMQLMKAAIYTGGRDTNCHS